MCRLTSAYLVIILLLLLSLVCGVEAPWNIAYLTVQRHAAVTWPRGNKNPPLWRVLTAIKKIKKSQRLKWISVSLGFKTILSAFGTLCHTAQNIIYQYDSVLTHIPPAPLFPGSMTGGGRRRRRVVWRNYVLWRLIPSSTATGSPFVNPLRKINGASPFLFALGKTAVPTTPLARPRTSTSGSLSIRVFTEYFPSLTALSNRVSIFFYEQNNADVHQTSK